MLVGTSLSVRPLQGASTSILECACSRGQLPMTGWVGVALVGIFFYDHRSLFAGLAC
jgi:hypothetical protein